MINLYRLRLSVAAIASISTFFASGCGALEGASAQREALSISMTADPSSRAPQNPRLVISIYNQKMALLDSDRIVKTFAISTARKGAGEVMNSGKTPRGRHEISVKIGDGAPLGAVFESLVPTGEIVAMNTPGITAISTRVMRLSGLESHNLNTFERLIYLNGTPAENRLGVADSGGNIRVSAREVIWLYDQVRVGTEVFVYEEPFDIALSKLEASERRHVSLVEKASAGDRSATQQLCYEHSYGINGTALRPASALKWCQQGEKMGDPPSIALLGSLLEEGKGIAKDIEGAKAYYHRAAEAGNPFAHFRLAHLAKADMSKGVDDGTMYKHLLAAAELGHTGAKSWLATLPKP